MPQAWSRVSACSPHPGPDPDRPLRPPHHLQEVEVPVVGNEDCNRHYQNTSADAARQIIMTTCCAGSVAGLLPGGTQARSVLLPSPPTRGHCRALRAASPAG